MNRVVITGVGVLSPAGVGVEAFRRALSEGRPLGEAVDRPGRHRRPNPLKVAKIPPFDREQYLPARKLRRMGELSQIWTLACLLARSDAGLEEETSAPPQKRGTFLGTGLGCTDTTWEYLEGMLKDGMGSASPYLFAESVANAPAGHSAIEMDARGTCVTLTCGDASAAAALGTAARALREGRLEMAYCGGVELMTAPLLRALGPLGGPSHLGEGAVCLILETLQRAKSRNARLLAEVTGNGLASDPQAPATSWSRDWEVFALAMRRAVERSGGKSENERLRVGSLLLHACGWRDSDEAERVAGEAVCPGVRQWSITPIFGTHAASGGLALAAAALETREHGSILLSAHAWGGGAYSLLLRAN
jgi:3-oxoacyl-[acyl-carrier-protein] synthase II